MRALCCSPYPAVQVFNSWKYIKLHFMKMRSLVFMMLNKVIKCFPRFEENFIKLHKEILKQNFRSGNIFLLIGFREMKGERERFVVPLIYASTHCFLYAPWQGIKLATSARGAIANWATWPGLLFFGGGGSYGRLLFVFPYFPNKTQSRGPWHAPGAT